MKESEFKGKFEILILSLIFFFITPGPAFGVHALTNYLRKWSYFLVISLPIATLYAFPTSAATIRVPADQSTIQAGINATSSGDIVLVSPGIYRERIDFLGKAIELRSKKGPNCTIIDGSDAGSVVTFNSGESLDSILNGFTIQNGEAEDGGGIHCFEASPTIRNCTIRDNRAQDWGGGILCYSNASPTIRNCLLDDNVANMGGGICCRNAHSPTITHCVISNNHSTNDGGGIQLWNSWPMIENSLFHGNSADYDGGGIHGWDGGSATVLNCTLFENRAVRKGGGIFGGSGGSFAHSTYSMMNCILWHNDASEGPEIALFYHGSTLDIRFSDVRGGEALVFVDPTCVLHWGTGNIDADPRFIEEGNFHLTSVSPCIDAGMDTGLFTDLDGDPRPHGNGFDIGADEFSTEPCSVIASSGNQFVAFYLFPALAIIFFISRRFFYGKCANSLVSHGVTIEE